MPTYPRVPTQNNRQYTLDAQISAGASSLTVNQTVAGVVRAPGYLVIDRIDTSGGVTATKREYKYFTNVNGANITGLSSSDGTDQIHAVGAIVEFTPNVGDENDKYGVFTTEHSDLGQHASLPSLGLMRSLDIVGWSLASLQLTNTKGLVVASVASLQTVGITTGLFASGASVIINTLNPAWQIAGVQSLATVGVGKPLSMPNAGFIQWASVVLSGPVSGASVLIDINRNASSIFVAGTRLSILGGGTYASTASLNTRTFIAGDVFSVDVDQLGNKIDATVQFRSI